MFWLKSPLYTILILWIEHFHIPTNPGPENWSVSWWPGSSVFFQVKTFHFLPLYLHPPKKSYQSDPRVWAANLGAFSCATLVITNVPPFLALLNLVSKNVNDLGTKVGFSGSFWKVSGIRQLKRQAFSSIKHCHINFVVNHRDYLRGTSKEHSTVPRSVFFGAMVPIQRGGTSSGAQEISQWWRREMMEISRSKAPKATWFPTTIVFSIIFRENPKSSNRGLLAMCHGCYLNISQCLFHDFSLNWRIETTERNTPVKLQTWKCTHEAPPKNYQFPLPSLLEKVNIIPLTSWIDGMNPLQKVAMCIWRNYCWWFRNPAVTRVLIPSNRWLGMGFLKHQQYVTMSHTWGWWNIGEIDLTVGYWPWSDHAGGG